MSGPLKMSRRYFILVLTQDQLEIKVISHCEHLLDHPLFSVAPEEKVDSETGVASMRLLLVCVDWLPAQLVSLFFSYVVPLFM